MSELFLKLLNMSMTASWLILAVVVLRLVLKKAPKWVHCILWALVAVRLICPFSFESKLSLVPDADVNDAVDAVVSQMGKSEMQDAIDAVGGIDGPTVTVEAEIGVNGGADISGTTPDSITSISIIDIASAIWLAGMVALLLYALISYLRLRRRVSAAMLLQENIWLCDTVESPFILGFFRPRIYLPSSIAEGDMEHVLAHEHAHLQRRDHWWKPIGYVLLAVYWFNPLIWVAYILLCRDIELACDEKVIKCPDTDRRAYSEALLACSVKRSAITACPLAFGEVSVRGRIKSVLNYKKPAFWIILVALVACIVAAVCFLTDPIKPTVHDVSDQKGYRITTMVRNVTMPVTVPVDVLGEDIYSNEGHVYEPDEVVVYQNGTTTVYLEHVRYLEQYGEKHLYFDFRFDYEILDEGMVRTLFEPNIKDGKTASSSIGCGVSNRMAWDSSATYLDGARLYGVNQGVEASVAIKTDVVQSAQDYIAFDLVGLTDIFYEKGSANHEDDIEILTTEEEYRAYIQEKYDVYNVARQNNVDPEELTDAIIEGLNSGFFSPFVELEVLNQAIAAVGRADEPLSVTVDSDKVDASNPALETAMEYVTQRMETFNESWKTIATGNRVTEGKVTALESVASVAMENIRLDLYRLEFRMLLDGNPNAVENGGMSHETIDGEIWLTEWESLGQPYILHCSEIKENGQIDWKTIAVTSDEEIGHIYVENRDMETELGLDKYTIVAQKLYEEYLENGAEEPIVNYRGWLKFTESSANGKNVTVNHSILNSDEPFSDQPLEITEDPMTYQERLDWVKSGVVYTETLENGGETSSVSLGQWQEGDGCLAYVWQPYGSPHPGVCMLTIRFADGTQARLPLPNEQTNRTAKPTSMEFQNGKFVYDVQLDSEWPENEDIQKRMYHYELDLTKKTLSLSLGQTESAANSTVANAMLAAVETLLAEELPATITKTDEMGRIHPLFYKLNAWDSINGKNSCRGILNHTYQEVNSLETSNKLITLEFTVNRVDWGLTFYDGTDSLSVCTGGAEYYFKAIPNYEDIFLSPLGSLIRRWYDEAEYMAMDGYDGKNIVIPNTGQSYLEAAQAWCEAYEGLHLKASSGSKERYTYVSCRVEAAEGATDMYRERGEIGENTYAFFARTAFVPENEQARQWSMAGNTGNYEGDDPNVPKEALEYSRCGYITLKEDGWHGVIVGTGF